MPAIASSTTDRIKDMQFAARVDVSLQAAEAADVLTLVIDVDMLADVALFGEDAVAS